MILQLFSICPWWGDKKPWKRIVFETLGSVKKTVLVSTLESFTGPTLTLRDVPATTTSILSNLRFR